MSCLRITHARDKRALRWLDALTGIAFILMMIPQGWAQVELGRVVGDVLDPTGAVIPGAAITVKNTATNIERNTATNSSGEFVVTQLQPGSYTISVEHAGYKKAEQAPFQLNINQVVSVKITLELGAVSQVVRVTGAQPLLESQTSSLGQVVGGQTIRDLPLNGRDFIQLTYLTAGVNAGPQGTVQQGNIPENERGNGAVQANGLQATNNNFLLDGFDNNEQQIGMELIQPSIDAIQEFKVQTNGFGADIGKGGAVINLAIRSGTNQFHGEVFEFIRNSVFDSRNYFDDPTLPVPPFRQNQFGGSLGGPILRNKLFFFTDYQGTRIAQSQTDISTVPPLSERTGDFSDLLTGQTDPATGYDTGQIFDPLSYDPSTGTRQPFPGNIIPKKSLDSAALNTINIFPAPNKPGTANNFLLNPTSSNNQDQFDIRVDGVLGAKDNISALFSYGNVYAFEPDPLPGLAGGGNFTGNIANLARFGGISDVHTFSSDKINELKLGYGRYVVEAIQNFAGQDIATQLGIPGINVGNLQDTGGLPNISISNLSPLGNQDYFPEFLRENNYQLIDSFSYLHGKHSIKAGIDLRRRKNGFYQVQNARGDLFFDQQFTDNLSDGVGGSPVASFLLGYPISAFRDGLKSTFGQSWWEFGAYIMDDYRVTPKLTLNLGLRYDIYTPYIEDHNRIANFNFATGEFVSPQMPGVSRSGNVRTNLLNFAPRVGFAYTPASGRTTLRGAYGIFYDLQADQGDAELAYNPTGFYFSQSITNPATTPSLRLSTGFPPIVYPSLQNPFGRASAAPFNNATPYIQEWNLNIEQQLTKDMVLQIAYAGIHAVKLLYLYDRNQPVLPLDSNFGPAPNYGRPHFNTVPNIAAVRTEANIGYIEGNDLEVTLEKRFSKSWSMLNAYTWGHVIGMASEDEAAGPQNSHNLKAERGDNAPDIRNQFTSALSYVPPFGKGRRFLSGDGVAQQILGDWQLGGIVALYSGQSLTPHLSFDPTNTSPDRPRPDVIGNPYNFSNAIAAGCPSNHQSLACWFNPGAYAIPALATGQSFATNFGNARRGTLRGPATYNVDASIFKNFPFRRTWNLELRVEAFNLFNLAEFANPDTTTDVQGVSASISSTAIPARQLQFAVKLRF